jgi:hypothetical protein
LNANWIKTSFIYFVCSSSLVLFVLNTIVTLCIAFQGAMSFSPTGKDVLGAELNGTIQTQSGNPAC